MHLSDLDGERGPFAPTRVCKHHAHHGAGSVDDRTTGVAVRHRTVEEKGVPTTSGLSVDVFTGGPNGLPDGQVPLDRAMFWPGFAAELNPAQPPYRSALLAVFNTHHWALCIQGMDAEPNGFPRDVLLESLVAFVALGAGT